MTKLLSAALLLVSFALVSACSKSNEATTAEPVARVHVQAVTLQDLPVVVSGYGGISFNPAEVRTLTNQVEAQVVGIEVQSGEQVSNNQILLRLATTSASNLELTQVHTDAGSAKSEYDRQMRLREDGLASDADVEKAKNAFADLSAREDALLRSVKGLRSIQSDISGIVETISVSVGDIVQPGTVLIRLASQEAIQAKINLEVEDASRIQIGSQINLKGLNGIEHTASSKVQSIDLRIDPTTRMSAIFAQVPVGQGFMPGEAVRAEIIATINQSIPTVPVEALLRDENGDFLFVAKDGIAHLQRVSLGIQYNNQVEIITGVQAGDLVVTQGGAVLSQGMKLAVEGGDQ